jgi:DegV family protein with EDD domain
VLPIAILLGSEVLPDATDVAGRVYRAFAEDAPAKSAPPSVIEYLDAIESGDFDAAVVLTPAAEFTVMYQNARLAASMSRRQVEVVDTRTAAAGQGLIVTAAAQALEAGASAPEVAEVARETARRTELVAMLPGLTSIQRSGHVPAPALEGTAHAGAEPLFRFREGCVVPLGRPDPQRDGMSVLHEEWRASGGADAERTLFFHAANEDAAVRFRSLLGCDEPMVEFSPAMAVHTGVGCLGVAWVRR